MVRIAGESAVHERNGAPRTEARRARQAREAAARDEAHGWKNVNTVERALSVAAGGALAAYALRR